MIKTGIIQRPLLRDLHLISREIPVLEKYPHKSKKGIYKIVDPFFKLWFSIVYPYESFIEFGEIKKTKARDRLNDLLGKHFSYCFEELSRQYTQFKMYDLNCIKVGRQWDRNYEIDVAGVNEKNELTVLGECKWSNSKVGLSVYEELMEKVTENELPIAADCKFLFFSKSGFSDELMEKSNKDKTISLISVDQLFV